MRINAIQIIIDIIRGKAIKIGFNKLIVRQRLRNKKNIPIVKVIGDSHTSFFSGHSDITFKHFEFGINNCVDKLENFITFHIGPALAYNLNRYNSTTKAREKIDYLIKKNYIKAGDTILLSFGCIDTSMHILKHAKKNSENSLEENINITSLNVIDNYLEGVNALKDLGLNIYLWGALPQTFFNEEIPEIIERNKVVKIFNKLLSERAKEHNIKVLSIYDKLINKDYSSKNEFYSDGAHLNKKAWEIAIDEIKKIDILRDIEIKV